MAEEFKPLSLNDLANPNVGGLSRSRRSVSTPQAGQGEATVLDKTAGAFFLGVAEDPLIEPILDATGFDDQTRANLRGRLKDSTAADVFEFVGEWGPAIALGGGAFGAGRVLARKGLQKFGTKAAKEFLSQGVGGLAKSVTPSVLVGQAAGGSAAIGALEGTREFVETGDVGAALQTAGTAAALSLAFEGAAFGVGKAFTKLRGQQSGVSQEVVEAGAVPAARQLGDDVAALRSQETVLRERIRTALGTDDQAKTLVQAVRRDLGPVADSISPGAISSEVAERLAGIRPLRQELRATKTARKALGEAAELNPANAYLRETPLNPQESALMVKTLVSGLAEAPEALGRKLGVVGTNLVRKAGDAERAIEATLIHSKATIFKAQKEIADSFGGKALKDDRWRELFEVWELGGEEGVKAAARGAGRSADDAARAAKAFSEVDTMLTMPARQLERMGGPTALTAQELSRGGVAKYIPKRMVNTSQDVIDQRLASFGLDETRQAAIANQGRTDIIEEGTRKLFGIPEFQGSLNAAAKRFSKNGKSTLLVDDPWEAVLGEVMGSHKRIQYGKFLGVTPGTVPPRGGIAGTGARTTVGDSAEATAATLAADAVEPASVQAVKQRIIAASGAEGASPSLMNTLYDSVSQKKYYDGGMSALASLATSIQIPAKLTFSVITNASGTVSTGLKFGYLNAAKQLIKGVKGEVDEDFLKAAGVLDDMTHGMMDQYRMDAIAKNTGNATLDGIGNAADKAAKFVLDKTGFSLVERWNRVIAANTGLEFYRRTTAMAAAGKLKGATLAARRRAFKDIGVDLDDMVKRLPSMTKDQVAELEQRVAFNSMRTTQFAPSPTRKPTYWNSPIGRMMSQFKGFAFGQARFVGDAVFREAGQGNILPLATFLSVYPVAGEFVKDAKALARLKGRDSSGPQRLVENILAVGGLGLASDLMMSSKFGGGKGLTSSIVGPTLSDISELGAAALTAPINPALAAGRAATFVGRQPAIQAPFSLLKFGAMGWQELTEAIDSGEVEAPTGGDGPPAVKLEDFQTSNRRR